MPGRRSLLLAGAAGLARPARGQDLPGLREIAARNGVEYGLAVRADWLRDQPAYAAAVARDARLLVPEGGAKWWDLRPTEAVFDFAALDAMLDFAARHGQAVRGHTLVWHAAMRDWTLAALAEGPVRARALLEAHLDGVLGHVAGRIGDWDVANEAVADPRDSAALLRDTPWLEALGPGYLDLAFRLARARDPSLRLTYNDYGCEQGDPVDDEKRRRVLALLRGFRDRGVPVDALGIQGHLRPETPVDAAALAGFVRTVRDLGFEVLITELDVIEKPPFPGDVAAQDAAVASVAHRFVSTALEAGVRSVLAWGAADSYSWIQELPRGPGPAPRPLPLDDDFARKPMWHALARAFEGRPWP